MKKAFFIAVILTVACTWLLPTGRTPDGQTGSPVGATAAATPAVGPATPRGPGAGHGTGRACAQTCPANPDAGTGPAAPTPFGSLGAVKLEDIPDGTFKTAVVALPPEARTHALFLLGHFAIPTNDVESLQADETGELLYACPGTQNAAGHPDKTADAPETRSASGTSTETAATATTATATATATAPVPISYPPIRHSRPGASATIYLDFNGHTFSGTAWLSGATRTGVALDTDGDPTTFNDAEQAMILRVWESVAEDYRPFDVDVTTEEPVAFGPRTARALITKSTAADGQLMPSNTAGGVAYVGVFGRSDYASRYSPALIYYDRLSKYAPYIAEAASHEVGHNLGLSHDGTAAAAYYQGHGTGETSWAPIMGASYYKNVTQWSKGEYYNANNKQDDLSILAGYLGRPQTSTTASAQTANPEAVAGAILSQSAPDTYEFSTYSKAVVTVSPLKLAGTAGGNLDPKMEILNAQGAVLLSLDPEASTTINSTLDLPKGKYYVRVLNSVGFGNPYASTPTGYGSYGCLGSYTLSVAVDASPFEAWSQTMGISSDPMEEIDNDGILNLHRYGFGIPPGTTGATTRMPQVGTIRLTQNASYLTTTFRRNRSAAVEFRVEQSFDLATWAALDIPSHTVATADNGDGTDSVTVRADAAMETATAVFLRVVLTL